MILLDVLLTLPSGEQLKTGTLVTADPDPVKGGIEGQFRYDPAYLSHPQAFALDPFHLPLTAEIFNADRPQSGIHGVFEDSLPDDWGRKIMIRRHGLGRTEQRAPNLLRCLQGNGLGSLSYKEKAKITKSRTMGAVRNLQELERLAHIFENDPLLVSDDELSLLFQAGSSPGGARPKALVKDDDGYYIAKFSSINDSLAVVSLEAAAMELAHRAGIETAETRLVQLATGNCLLVKRFDISNAGGCNHLVSMQTLLKADHFYNLAYGDLAELIRHVSSQPGQDLQRLYKQMVFNVMIGNTDDHLKNFLMLHDETGWRLSPAFDLVPNTGFNSEHVLRIGTSNRVPDIKALLVEACAFGIKRSQQAKEIINVIHTAVSDWPEIFDRCGVPEDDSRKIGVDITRRLQLTEPQPSKMPTFT